MCIWVLAGSPVGYMDGLAETLPRPDAIIAANGGSALASYLGIKPTLVIGDLDSADPALINSWEAEGVEMRRYSHTTKSETDTELAVLAAVDLLGASQGTIYMLNATGGRLDHSLANVLLLTHPAFAEVDLCLVEANSTLFLAKPGRQNQIDGKKDNLLTLLPIGDVSGVTLSGCRYPLEHETLLMGRGRGVSNEIVSDNASVSFGEGLLLVVVTKRESAGNTSEAGQPKEKRPA